MLKVAPSANYDGSIGLGGASRVRGLGLERTCRLKPMLGRGALPNVGHFGPNIV